MGSIGISSGISRFGAQGPANIMTPGGANPVTGNPQRQWYESGPFWTFVFLAVGYILVYRTLK